MSNGEWLMARGAWPTALGSSLRAHHQDFVFGTGPASPGPFAPFFLADEPLALSHALQQISNTDLGCSTLERERCCKHRGLGKTHKQTMLLLGTIWQVFTYAHGHYLNSKQDKNSANHTMRLQVCCVKTKLSAVNVSLKLCV